MMELKNVRNVANMIEYFSSNLDWNIDIEDFDDINDIFFDLSAEDIGLKAEAFAKIITLKQLQPLIDGQKWGIFCVEFDSKHFEITALRKILSGLVPKLRSNSEYATWHQKDLLFICSWGKMNSRTIGIAHFEDKDNGLPQIKMISCEPEVEDFDYLQSFEDKLQKLKWPNDEKDVDKWRETWSSAFTSIYGQIIKDSETLTKQLAGAAQNIKELILNILEIESANGYVHLLYEKFKDTLIHDMTEQQFADMYAQTVVYGLFSARCMDTTSNDFSAEEAIECIPNTNPFLKNLMKECLGTEQRNAFSFDELEIGNVIDILLNTNTEQIIQDFNRQTGGGKEDPVIYFYEGFLNAYEKEQKKRGGVYYTPSAVVNFMVRSVHSILCNEFSLEEGLKSEIKKTVSIPQEGKKRNKRIEVAAVQVLDPATGTGTFLRQVIMQIYHTFRKNGKFKSQQDFLDQWNTYVNDNLLPRINGYEIMMAPYAVAHMKLAMLLKKTGYRFNGKNRLQVFLTNSLEQPGHSDNQMSLFSDPLASESIAANQTKKNRNINVCIGNPPYNAASQNNGEWILNLIKEYKMEPGGMQKLVEKNPKWLNDDYVKFIRLCEQYISSNGEGILAFINPHGFIDNPTFRGMRWNLLRKFDKIYILDLHGNSNRKEKCPDGSKDENVFDIQQGVSINIFIKLSKGHTLLGEVYHADLWGTRDYKFDYLKKHDIYNIDFDKVDVDGPEYNFKPTNISLKREYEKGFRVDELFDLYSVGIVTAKDKVLINTDIEILLKNVSDFYEINADRSKVYPIYYRPLDQQYIYYDPQLLERSRENVMKMFHQENLGLITARSNKGEDCSQFLVTDIMAEAKCGERTTQSAVFPLYRYTDEFGKMKKISNLNTSIIDKIQISLGLKFTLDDKKIENTFTAEQLLAYIYAVLYTPSYRKKYKEFINVSFPRIPYPSNTDIFWKLVQNGEALVKLHLMHDNPEVDKYNDDALVGKIIEKVQYKNGNVYINKYDCVVGVNENVWNYIMCGYQPIQKWLKDRKGTVLKPTDLYQLRKMQLCINETLKICENLNNLCKW